MRALQHSLASQQQRHDIEVAVAVYVALLVGVALTATLHSAVGPTARSGSRAHSSGRRRTR